LAAAARRGFAALSAGRAVTLGLARGLVRLEEHDATWRESFVAERDRLQASLIDCGCETEHIGSTAVPGMPAKPILDIAVGCPEWTSEHGVRARLEALGYEYRGDMRDSSGHVFARGPENARTHYIHLIRLSDPQWSSYLALRDFYARTPMLARATPLRSAPWRLGSVAIGHPIQRRKGRSLRGYWNMRVLRMASRAYS
jgi:GrpB-like predicted nucleotidyltransferase (UPF0157 family)